MSTSRRPWLAAMLLLPCAPIAHADEAVEPTGKKHAGRLLHEKDAWLFRTDSGKPIGLDTLAFVHFDIKPIPVPKAPLHAVLLLPHEQRVTGTLVSVDTKNIVFATSWGKVVELPRPFIVGVEQANDSMMVVSEAFEADLKSWRLAGKPKGNAEHVYFGKSSLCFDAAGQEAARTWKPGLRAGAIRLFFFDAGGGVRWRCAALTADAKTPSPTFLLDSAGYTCTHVTQVFAAKRPTPGWHLLAIEIADDQLRIFVDDVCLGQSTLSSKEAIVGIQCVMEREGKLWIDELSVTHRLRPLPLPKPVPEQDCVWLEHGEQLYGRVVFADADNVVLDAKFGKRAYPWSRTRGILFAQPPSPVDTREPEITFRPGPGFPLDRVRGKLLRWDKEILQVEHRLLGTIPLERDRLDKLRPVPK